MFRPREFYFRDFCDGLIVSIRERFAYVFDDPLFSISSILDPNYGTTFLNKQARAQWLAKLRIMFESLDDNRSLRDIQESG